MIKVSNIYIHLLFSCIVSLHQLLSTFISEQQVLDLYLSSCDTRYQMETSFVLLFCSH